MEPTGGPGLAILFEDAHLLALDKPAGTTSQGPPAAGASLEDQVRAYLGSASAFVGVVHRLDRPTSGVILWAKTVKAARRAVDAVRPPRGPQALLGRGPGAGRAPGRPLGGLAGADPAGVDRRRLGRGGTAGPHGRHGLRGGGGRPPAVGDVAAVAVAGDGPDASAAGAGVARGLPILGDASYGSKAAFPAGIALHARSLEVRHPITAEPLRLVAPLPPSWVEAGIGLPYADDPETIAVARALGAGPTRERGPELRSRPPGHAHALARHPGV